MGEVVRTPLRRVAVPWSVAVVLVALALAGWIIAHRTVTSSAPVPGQPVPASALPRLTAIADQAIESNGARSAAWASAVVTTQEALNSASPNATVPLGATPIDYLVTIKGHFTDDYASPPAGSPAPTGTYLWLVIDAKTFQGLDGGLQTRSLLIAPARLGKLTYLKVS
jgi:hypothetical protein